MHQCILKALPNSRIILERGVVLKIWKKFLARVIIRRNKEANTAPRAVRALINRKFRVLIHNTFFRDDNTLLTYIALVSNRELTRICTV